MTALERLARQAWIGWGVYGQFQPCDRCSDYVYCYGKRRDWLICLDCFDETGGKR